MCGLFNLGSKHLCGLSLFFRIWGVEVSVQSCLPCKQEQQVAEMRRSDGINQGVIRVFGSLQAGSYNWGYKCLNMGYNSSYPAYAYNPTYNYT